MSENWKLQVSPKLADGTLINLRAETPEEFDQVVNWATTNAAKFVDVVTAINAVNKVPALAGNVTSTQVQNDAPQQGSWSQPQQQAAPSWSQPATPAPGNGPGCRHGAMQFKEGTSKAGKPYKMWACPSGNRQDQCDPQWVR